MKKDRRYALVTGASSDVGAAIALNLASTGHSLWITYSSSAQAAHTVAEQVRQMGAEVHVSRLDLRSLNSIHALTQEIDDRWGSLDVLVNNAAASSFTKTEDLTIEDWDDALTTNARGTFFMSRSVLSLMRKRSSTSLDRSIVNLGAISGQVGALQAGMNYAASKAAVLAITRSFARMLAGEGIRVNAVSPGPLDTSMVAHVPPERKRILQAAHPLGRFGTPEEVAWIVGMLASPHSSFITGATYDGNGGARIDS